jgi:hypothetical protein
MLAHVFPLEYHERIQHIEALSRRADTPVLAGTYQCPGAPPLHFAAPLYPEYQRLQRETEQTRHLYYTMLLLRLRQGT